ncbi:hypothetical protein K504DRAFT_479060, partial [Pleomassaria siparia CBS 279.74]
YATAAQSTKHKAQSIHDGQACNFLHHRAFQLQSQYFFSIFCPVVFCTLCCCCCCCCCHSFTHSLNHSLTPRAARSNIVIIAGIFWPSAYFLNVARRLARTPFHKFRSVPYLPPSSPNANVAASAPPQRHSRPPPTSTDSPPIHCPLLECIHHSQKAYLANSPESLP